MRYSSFVTLFLSIFTVSAHAAVDFEGWPPFLARLAQDVNECKKVPSIDATVQELKATRLVEPKPLTDKDEERIYQLVSPVALSGKVAFDRIGFYGADSGELVYVGFMSRSSPREVGAALKSAGLRTSAKSKSRAKLTTTTTMDGKGTYWTCGQG